MRLKTLELNNLFSFDSVIIDYYKRGLLLISGHSYDEKDSNGSGKSSISTNGLTWVMYGKVPSDEARINADDVINRHTGRKTGWGKLSFISHDGNEYTILRQRNPNKLEVFLDDVNLASREMSVTQDLIDRLLGKNLQAFLQTDFFGQGRKMSYLSLSPADRRATLESLLPYESLEPIQEMTKATHSTVKAMLVAKTKEHDVLSGKAQAMKAAVHNLKTAMDNWSADWHARMAELKKQAKSKVNIDLSVARANLKTYQEQKAIAETEFSKLNEEWSAAKGEQHRLIAEHSGISFKMRELRKSANNCPTCGQQLGALAAHDKEKELLALEEQFLDTENQVRATDDKVYELNIQRREHQLNAASCADRINHIIEMISAADVAEAADLQQQQMALAKETNPHTDLYYNTLKEETDLAVQVSWVSGELNDLKKEEQDISFWLSVFGKDLKTALLGAICPYLEARTAHHLAKLNNPQLKVEFSTIKYLATGEVKEEFSVRVTSDTGGGTYALLSGGEKQLVNFAVGLALADIANLRVKNTSSVLILDEPFVQLGPNNSQSVISYLTELTGVKETILLISNETALQSLVPNKVRVTKSCGVSTLEGV